MNIKNKKVGKETKPHIGIFGRRNNGKSSIINYILQQDIAIVSATAGTTTDPVKKSTEIPNIGASVIIDTAGIDDVGELGNKRIKKTIDTVKIIDIALLIICKNTFGKPEQKLIEYFKKYDVPFVIVHNKADLETISKELEFEIKKKYSKQVINFSTTTPNNQKKLLTTISNNIPTSAYKTKSLMGDIIKNGDIVLLITPIDTEAPEGRLILPQVQAIRDILDNNAIAIVAKENEAYSIIKKINPKPALVVCDSQVFDDANKYVPEHIPLTSFSTVLAKHKGDFKNYLKGTPQISKLKDNDKILILESCSHQVSCEDIGRVKIPKWLNNFTNKKLKYEVVSGLDDTNEPIENYAMVIQCGGCMVTRKQLINRLKPAIIEAIPITNYGMAIAYMHGIFKRATAPFMN